MKLLILASISLIACNHQVVNSILVNNNNNSTSESQQANDNKALDSNSTFYYEADAFLLNSSKPNSPKADSKFEPAPVASLSGRNGRMLDLDALVGDLAASQANKLRSQTGDRQSRQLSVNGRKLQIQGFIPIIGLASDSQDSQEELEQPQRNVKSAHQLAINHDTLPYAQSSLGHASFNVQRFLNTEPEIAQPASLSGQQVVEAKFNHQSSVVDALKKPIKRLANSFGGGASEAKAEQNCLCVPFYMCKNGLVNESSLGRSQVQQMLIQQQQQQQQQIAQQPRQLDAPTSGSHIHKGTVESVPAAPQVAPTSSSQSYANSFVPVDERSFEREIITAAPPTSEPSGPGEPQQQQNATTSQVAPDGATSDPKPVASQQDLIMNQMLADFQTLATTGSGANSSTTGSEEVALNSDYSQDILGRMLGLKQSTSAGVSPSGQLATTGGVCGLLRTCCGIPAHLNPQIAQSQVSHQVLPAPAPAQHQLQHFAKPIQNFHQPQMTGSLSISRMQSIGVAPLAHRTSNQYSARPSPLPVQAVAQFARTTPLVQPLQSFQQQQQPAPTQSSLLRNQQPLPVQQQQQQQLGTRKLLDGRCGLRQSAGINGRVQNLQYSENAADFGEYPAQAAILKRLNGSESLFVCSGTLISSSWVATAAHCIRKHAGQGGELKVRLGEWDVHRDDEFYPYVEREVRDLVVHPDFVPGNLINDLALLRLDAPLDPTLPHINPACLPLIDESFSNRRCWVTGWGKDSFGQRGSFQSVLQEVELPVMSHSACESALRQTRLGPHYRLHPGFLCAGGEGGRDACEGDGGSGLYCSSGSPGDPLKVVGLVSWGIGCGQPGVPGVYVSMAAYRPWIENIISIDEDIYSSYSTLPFGLPASSSNLANSLISERSTANLNVSSPPQVNSTTSE